MTCVEIPDGVNGEAVRAFLLTNYGIEIASSFGPMHGKIWRIEIWAMLLIKAIF